VSGGWTPGPWKVFRVESGPNRGKLLGIGDAQAGGVTDAFGGLWRSGKEMDANACLIAAAPDLLAALEALVRCFDIKDGISIRDEQALKYAAHVSALARGERSGA
jgi:hypothetical protein